MQEATISYRLTYKAKARSFQIIDGKIMPSFKVIDKVGEVAGEVN